MLQKAIDKVNELIAMDMGSLVEDKKDRMREKVCQSQNIILSFSVADLLPAEMA